MDQLRPRKRRKREWWKQPLKMSGDSLCGEHPEEKLRFVCVPCDTPICRDCKLTEHEGHRSIDIAKVAVGLKDKVRTEGRFLT